MKKIILMIPDDSIEDICISRGSDPGQVLVICPRHFSKGKTQKYRLHQSTFFAVASFFQRRRIRKRLRKMNPPSPYAFSAEYKNKPIPIQTEGVNPK